MLLIRVDHTNGAKPDDFPHAGFLPLFREIQITFKEMKTQKTMVLGTSIETQESRLVKLDDISRTGTSFVVAHEDNKTFMEIDYSWLPLCSDSYKISPKIEDYIFVSVPIITADVPNRNLQAFPFLEVSSWDINQGRPVYKTFVGKPTYTNHKNNTIPHLAKGVHFDSTLDYADKYGLYKINVLLGFDKTKDPGLTDAIQQNKGVTGYSMGAMVETFLDTISGKFIGLNDPEYKKNRGSIDKSTGKLRYLCCVGATFFETSCLGDFGRGDPGEPPADHTATSDVIWK
jgi:hypothetical protein